MSDELLRQPTPGPTPAGVLLPAGTVAPPPGGDGAPSDRPEEREVSWLDPCIACGGTEGCTFEPPHTIRCLFLDNGLGRTVFAESGHYTDRTVYKYDRRQFRHVPGVETAVQLLRRFFFSRTDVVCHFARWDSPCPAVGEAHLDAMLRAHVGGRREKAAMVYWKSKKNSGEYKGKHRIGSYGPAPDGTTKWLCIDFDGGGDHSAPLADPLAVALSAQLLCHRAGLPAYTESSKSAKGWHLWVFFDPPPRAATARELGYLIAPDDVDLTDGSLADPEGGKGIEIFPKADAIREGGVGNQVWLPWFWKSAPGGNLFFRPTPRGFEPFVPDDFETADLAHVERALEKLQAIRSGVQG